jgi:hypothetical protein
LFSPQGKKSCKNILQLLLEGQGFLIKMECVVFEAFVMAEGHLCVKNAAIRDAEVAFGHDKSHLRRDKYHLYIFMRKPLWK